MHTKAILVFFILVLVQSGALAAFGGKPPLGPNDALRHEFKPYDLFKLNYLGMNYCENLLDMRVNTPAYTHLGFDSNNSDAWNLHFPDDAGRLMEGIAWEDQFSPVVRLELMRRMVKGMLAAHIPGTKAYFFFRHRSGGKTFEISQDAQSVKTGRLTVSNLGDAVEHWLTVGFRAQANGAWSSVEQFKWTDDPLGAADQGTARSPRHWNESPYTIKRSYVSDAAKVDFTGRYWLSDEDMPLEFAYKPSGADHLQIVVGEPGKAMTLLGDKNVPAVIHLPDGKTFASDVTGDKTFEKPGFNYMILRKPTAFGSPGYSTALLIMWEGHPERIEALAPNGYGEIRLDFGKSGGKIWLYPFPWVNSKDMDYIHLNARSFLRNGKLAHNGYPSQQLVNAGAAGLASGAYLLSKYNDPLAVTARINAANAVDELFDAEKDGMKLVRVFFVVKAAAWMVKTGKAIGDQRMIDKYTPLVDQAMHRMLTEGYDGKGWGDGWSHFNAIKAVWLAYDATGNKDYLAAYERALTVYTIDAKGIYRYGVAMAAPGGFETYSGALALGAWGNAGKLDYVNALINLDVPNGWSNPTVPLKDIWNDTGAGPWAQDDADPEYVGYALRGANMPQTPKYVLPLGSFPTYDASGKVEVTRQPIVENPFFPQGHDKLIVLPQGKRLKSPKVKMISGAGFPNPAPGGGPGFGNPGPGALAPAGHPLGQDFRILPGKSRVYKLDTKSAAGAGIDLRLKGRYRIDVSPDGKLWYTRLETWSDKPCDQSIDLSTFTGSHDELIKLQRIAPESDICKLDVKDVTECQLELIVGNGYRVQCSSDGKTWHDGINATQIKAKPEPDAAWMRMLDVSKYLGGKAVYIKLSDLGKPELYGGKRAFLSRLTVYGVLKSGSVFVRLTNTSNAGEALVVDQVVFRSW
jgi:hypothetical protein